MLLWSHWWFIVSQLRPACSRQRTFLWLAVALAAMAVRRDLGGVTSFVRALGLKSACYGCLLDFFHSPRPVCGRLGADVGAGRPGDPSRRAAD